MRPSGKPTAPPRDAFTLLEVILALAILAGALAVLGEVARLSNRNAHGAALESEAALVAESVLSELDAGTAQLVAFNGDWTDDEQAEPEWRYNVVIEQTSFVELLQARVTVEEIDPGDEDPIRFQLIRWYQDPEYIASVEAALQSAEASSGTGASATGAMQ